MHTISRHQSPATVEAMPGTGPSRDKLRCARSSAPRQHWDTEHEHHHLSSASSIPPRNTIKSHTRHHHEEKHRKRGSIAWGACQLQHHTYSTDRPLPHKHERQIHAEKTLRSLYWVGTVPIPGSSPAQLCPGVSLTSIHLAAPQSKMHPHAFIRLLCITKHNLKKPKKKVQRLRH